MKCAPGSAPLNGQHPVSCMLPSPGLYPWLQDCGLDGNPSKLVRFLDSVLNGLNGKKRENQIHYNRGYMTYLSGGALYHRWPFHTVCSNISSWRPQCRLLFPLVPDGSVPECAAIFLWLHHSYNSLLSCVQEEHFDRSQDCHYDVRVRFTTWNQKRKRVQAWGVGCSLELAV